MAHSRCRFCDYSGAPSPGAPEFCKACGSPFRLAPCPSCAAVNGLTATECYKCHCTLAFAAEPVEPEVIPSALVSTIEPSFEDAAAKASVPFPSLGSIRTIEQSSIMPDVRFNKTAGTILVLVIITAGVVGYRRYAAPDGAKLPETSVINAGTILKATPTIPTPLLVPANPVAQAVLAAKSPSDVAVTDNASKNNVKPATAASPAPTANTPTNVETKQATTHESARTIEARENRRGRQATAGAVSVSGASATKQSNAQFTTPVAARTSSPPLPVPPVRPCTEAVAALGLCSPESNPRK